MIFFVFAEALINRTVIEECPDRRCVTVYNYALIHQSLLMK